MGMRGIGDGCGVLAVERDFNAEVGETVATDTVVWMRLLLVFIAIESCIVF